MDNNNQTNPWQSNSNADQASAAPWGGTAGQINQFDQAGPVQVNGTQSSTSLSPPTYQPPVAYGAVNSPDSNYAQTSVNQFNQQPQVNSSYNNQSQQLTSQGQPIPPLQQTAFNSTSNSVDVSGQVSQPTTMGASQQASPNTNSSSQTPAVKTKQPLSQNQILFIVTGLVSVVALAVITVCVILVINQ